MASLAYARSCDRGYDRDQVERHSRPRTSFASSAENAGASRGETFAPSADKKKARNQ
jgi:hypothetical protein